MQSFTMGMECSWLPTLEISPAEAVASIHTVTRVPCCQSTEAWAALCLSSSADPDQRQRDRHGEDRCDRHHAVAPEVAKVSLNA